MDDVRREVLDDIEALLARFSSSIRSDVEAAEAWMAWSAMRVTVQSGVLEGTALEVLGMRAHRAAGVVAPALSPLLPDAV